jgi:hypothetical protein
MLVKSTLQTTQVDVTCRLLYNKVVWGGLNYRLGDAVSLLIGAELKGIRFGYSYDIGTSALARASGGSHELFASYMLKLDLQSKSKNKHKSIRIL